MLKTTLTLAAVSLTLLLSTSVFAQNVQYLGAHTVVDGAPPFNFVQGDLGVLEFNRRCAAAFDGAQMCESIDILRSGSFPDDAAKTAGVIQWVKPTIISVVLDPDPTLIPPLLRVFDASGVSALIASDINSTAGLSCIGWSTAALNQRGLAIDGDGEFRVETCQTFGFVAIACCKVKSGKK